MANMSAKKWKDSEWTYPLCVQYIFRWFSTAKYEKRGQEKWGNMAPKWPESINFAIFRAGNSGGGKSGEKRPRTGKFSDENHRGEGKRRVRSTKRESAVSLLKKKKESAPSVRLKTIYCDGI